jgi:hypothetical protein
MPTPPSLVVCALLLLGGCAATEVPHTIGEIPRDGSGRPVWSLITPSPPPSPTR